ncbi:MAG: TIGR01212 family radical SAM protein [Candidatus Altiarchaeales archaeon]|nr:TIGR01212 family radical SAM protein [Candidatus Altiarchaeota archaeon]MBU4436944.1 TIGR01212 family radical SAM protein [Candidatus Altiarchaeota archaeon]MCG2782109.1 TIGR01212 family radical SAM protein [Candidatus Altiarchaeales archaeon]
MKSDGIPTITEKKFIDELYKEGNIYAPYGLYERKAHGYKVFKIPLNASFTCPNWDGRLSKEGCIFCPNFARQFTYESFRRVLNEDLGEQVKDQVKYYREKGAGKKGFVYIAFGTNTYLPLDKLKKIFDTALKHRDVIGLSIGTRPDCLPDEVLDLLGEYVKKGKEIWLEIGQQSVHFHTDERTRRRHGVAESIRVVREAHKRGIYVLFFLIMGLPYETPSEVVETARVVSALGVDAVKLYPCLVMKGTGLQKEYREGTYRPLSSTEYAALIADFLEHLSPHVLIQRMSKDCGLDGKVAPHWDTHRWIVGPRVEKIMMLRGTKQGSKFSLGLEAGELKPLD